MINRRGYFAPDGSVLPMLRTKLSDTRGGSTGDLLLGDLVAVICHRGDERAGHWVTYSKGCLPKKKLIWRDIVPTSVYPLPPFKSREQNRKDIFLPLDSPPPLKTREICHTFLCYLKTMYFS